jgi:ABC-2 type transport system ATP-binding protein
MSTTTHADPAQAAISISGLTKRYGSVCALDGLDLHVAPGEVHGLLGPNGAGKSTTIRILLGILRQDRGTVRLLGGDPWRDAVELHRRLAYVPGDVELWSGLTGGEAIDLFTCLRGGVDTRRRDELIERFELDPPRKKGRTYSKGNRQKVALIAALASPVELLLLDEPTAQTRCPLSCFSCLGSGGNRGRLPRLHGRLHVRHDLGLRHPRRPGPQG